MTALSMTCSDLPDSTLISVSGEVDVTNSSRLASALVAGRRPGKPLILDLSSMTFLDSTGLSVLLDTHTAAERDGDGMYLVGVQHTPMRVLQITGVLTRLHLLATLEQALLAASRAAGARQHQFRQNRTRGGLRPGGHR
ncbi:STAS domain-containing protein [Nonomuraea sediminis]|uniref:STAS domain-containing protein n=1 Tax=Nonomuraea sediminis TaxID=2835864 RepID=UPI001BDD6FB8|nr:STAS domain-containing protein [Nonomuraea sediminis]